MLRRDLGREPNDFGLERSDLSPSVGLALVPVGLERLLRIGAGLRGAGSDTVTGLGDEAGLACGGGPTIAVVLQPDLVEEAARLVVLGRLEVDRAVTELVELHLLLDADPLLDL